MYFEEINGISLVLVALSSDFKMPQGSSEVNLVKD